jgi:hypothetical protein
MALPGLARFCKEILPILYRSRFLAGNGRQQAGERDYLVW